jgi:hypothetical protein
MTMTMGGAVRAKMMTFGWLCCFGLVRAKFTSGGWGESVWWFEGGGYGYAIPETAAAQKKIEEGGDSSSSSRFCLRFLRIEQLDVGGDGRKRERESEREKNKGAMAWARGRLLYSSRAHTKNTHSHGRGQRWEVGPSLSVRPPVCPSGPPRPVRPLPESYSRLNPAFSSSFFSPQSASASVEGG